MSNFGLILTAGGKGIRFGSKIPKQILTICGKPIFIHSLEVFLQFKEITSFVITYPQGFAKDFQNFIDQYSLNKKVYLVKGGNERMNSVWNGLNHQSIQECKYVIVHDSVRPFVSSKLIDRIIQEAKTHNAVIPALPTRETLKIGMIEDFVVQTIDRSKVVAVQTPQAFETKLLTDAFNFAFKQRKIFTDESSIIEAFGEKVKIIHGEELNFKITTKFDLFISECIININLYNKEL